MVFTILETCRPNSSQAKVYLSGLAGLACLAIEAMVVLAYASSLASQPPHNLLTEDGRHLKSTHTYVPAKMAFRSLGIPRSLVAHVLKCELQVPHNWAND